MPAKSFMIQGTGSFVGKSIIVSGLCRILMQDGFRVTPFKAQNMALNSFITREGGEMGRAQVVQAEAAGLQPHVDMNPILLKPHTDTGAQVIIHGKVFGNMQADAYHRFKKEALRAVLESYERLSKEFQVIVIEGAGSPAEINLREGDIANMGMAEAVDAPVLLVGDIDKGGVFASLVGTLELLSESERRRIKGFIINKFRGDSRLLSSGLDFLENKTGIPVLGVIPFLKDFNLPEEDGVILENFTGQASRDIDIAVIYLPHISNFTDFDALGHEPGVHLRYVMPGQRIGQTDVIILPGSKNTIEDLIFLRNAGYDREILEVRHRGRKVIGICGGFQMLGKRICDPWGMETPLVQAEGLGLLDVETILQKEKMTYQVKAVTLPNPSGALSGYEIHMGDTARGAFEAPAFKIIERLGCEVAVEDGAISADGQVWGTYIHGLFDNDSFRRGFIDGLRKKKGFSPLQADFDYLAFKEEAYNRLAAALRKNVDIGKIYRIAGLVQTNH